jgi:outer membrane protein assembly factor BamB
MTPSKRFLIGMAMAAVLPWLGTGCSSDWLGGDDETHLEGERISVLSLASDLKEDPSLKDVSVSLPPMVRNHEVLYEHQWNTNHLKLGEALTESGEFDGGDSFKNDLRLTASPVIADNHMYVLDGRGVVRSFALESPKKPEWEVILPTGEVPDELLRITFGTTRKDFQGGSLAYLSGLLFAATGNGMVVALNASDGSELWERGLGAPIRSAPVAKDGKVFAITITNQLFALDMTSGRTLWSQEGYRQTTSILGYPTPAVFENIVIAPFSSGELVALRTENGKPVWEETLALFSPKNSSVVTLNDIDASPIVEEGTLYAVSHEGVLVAVDILSGKRQWEQPISSLNTPWLSGDFLFVMTTRDELVCLHRTDGKIKWVVPFVSYEDEANKKHKIVWNGPVVAGGKIYVVGSHGVLVALDPAAGTVASTTKVNKDIYQPPLVVDGSMYLIDNKGEIQSFH